MDVCTKKNQAALKSRLIRMSKYNRDLHDETKGSACEVPKLTVILDEFDFTYTDDEMKLAAYLYDHGKTLSEIAEAVRPKLPEEYRMMEACLLVMHLGWKKKIKPANRAKDFWG